MDNLSHALSGLAAGELIHRCLPQEKEAQAHGQRRRLLLTTGMLAASFPDLDLVLTPLLPEPLGYLLHHRGHTHTFLYAIPQALLLASLMLLLWPSARRLLAQSRAALAGFGFALGAGFTMHIAMDYLNSYGVHPFHPIDSRWFYGDMIFIIEPVFWVAFGMPLFVMIRSGWLRSLLILALAASLIYFTVQGFLSWSSLAALAITGLVLALTQRSAGERSVVGILAGVVACTVFIAVQGISSAEGRRLAIERLQADETDVQVLDVAMTPFPANPVCWMFASIERQAEQYRARRGILSIAPDWVAPADCPAAFAQLDKASGKDGNALAIRVTHEGDTASLQSLYEQDCRFRAWMRFARIPYLLNWQARDMRFDRSGDNFTAIDLGSAPPVDCPWSVPQWGTPRTDLLDRDSGQGNQAGRRD